jgi:hypothetical protein
MTAICDLASGVKTAVTVMENCKGVPHRFAEPRGFPLLRDELGRVHPRLKRGLHVAKERHARASPNEPPIGFIQTVPLENSDLREKIGIMPFLRSLS